MKKAMLIIGFAVILFGFSYAQCRSIHNHHRGFVPPPPPPHQHMRVIRRHPHRIHYYPLREIDFYYDNSYYMYPISTWGMNVPYNRRYGTFVHVSI